MALRIKPLWTLVLAAGLAFACGGAQAAETGLSGLWLLSHGRHHDVNGQFHDADNIPLTPVAQAQMDAMLKANAVMAKQRCLPVGVPRMMINELPIEIVESAERIAIIGEQAELARTIYLNTDKHPADAQPDWNGNSYGKWVDGVLVVDVANFNDRVPHVPGTAKGSTSTHLVEKYKVTDGGQGLVIEMTFDDPQVLTRPFTVSYHYDRLPPGSQRWEYICDPDDPQWSTALGAEAGR